MSLLLDLGPRERFAYQLRLQLRSAGGVALEVVRVLGPMPG